MVNPLIYALVTFMAFAAAMAAISGEPKATVSSPAANATAPKFSCSDAVSALIPCETYLLGSGGNSPSAKCCQSAQKLNRAAAATADRKALCECLEEIAPAVGVKNEFLQLLPVHCKLQLKIALSTTANCSLV